MIKLNFFRKVKNYSSMLNFFSGPAYNIVKIDFSENTVTFRVKNKAVLVKYNLSEAVSDENVIDMLSPCEACWLGGCFGQKIHSEENAFDRSKVKSAGFKNDCSQCKIIFQNRKGEIGYIDQKSKEEFVASPVAIANNKYIVSKFSSSEACYIGILAGVHVAKNKNARYSMSKSAKLRLVKN